MPPAVDVLLGPDPTAWQRSLAAGLAHDASTPADVVLDLRHDAAGRAADGSWYVRLGDDDPRTPYLTALARGERALPVEVRRRAGRYDDVLARAVVRTQYSAAATRRGYEREAVACVMRALDDGAVIERVDHRPLRIAGRDEHLRARFNAARIFVETMFEYAFLEGVWNVAVTRGSPAALLEGRLPAVPQWWPEAGARRFFADPIVARDGDVVAVLAERFDPARGRATIAAVAADGRDAVDVIALDEHLSYPFVVRIGGTLYCIPEAISSGAIPVYRCEAFPGRWTLDRVMHLPERTGLIDPTLFAYDGRWWLFGSPAAPDSNAYLCAWHAPGPFGPWTPHRRNPIVVDASAGRPAGPLFVHDGTLLRPAQDSTRSYGGALALARVELLEPQRYRERVVARIGPPRGRYRHGIHTLCVDGDLIVVDGKRYALSIGKPLRLIRARGRKSH